MGNVGWLRAAVLGANDGLLSTASLIVGVAAAHADRGEVLVAGFAGMVAGAMSMAAGEYVSVYSQADTERADIQKEKREHAEDFDYEIAELAAIYVQRGLSPDLATQVAKQLMQHDALGAHLRDELGISELTIAQPLQAALTSAASFVVGAALPVAISGLMPENTLLIAVPAITIVALAGLGAAAAITGGASPAIGAARVTFWGALAMALTTAIGALMGTSV